MKVKYEYCPKCGTISKVIWIHKQGESVGFPKECRCEAEVSGHEYVTDEELTAGIETTMKEGE